MEISGWSPDGGQLIVTTWEKEGDSISSLDVKTGAMKKIKRWTSPDKLWRVRLSWNGRYLACRMGNAGENQRKISVIDLESANETTLIEKEVRDVVQETKRPFMPHRKSCKVIAHSNFHRTGRNWRS